MAKFTFNVNAAALRKKLEQALDLTMNDLVNHYVHLFIDPVWQWPRQTDRMNGETVDSPRDVVDLGHLMGSMSYNRVKTTVRFKWTEEYAMQVFLGEPDKGRPARNIPMVGLKEVQFAKTFADHFRSLL